MILFSEDWKKYPGAIADWETTNASFVRLGRVYESMGVKNHEFILSLLDPSLRGVDPHSPDLTPQQMLAITNECRRNFWYFLREVARDPSKAGGKARVFKANRGNISALWLFHTHITPILIQPRQTGKSFSINQLITWLLNIRGKGMDMSLLTKDDKLRAESMERIKDIESALPFYMRMRTSKDKASTEMLTIDALKNSYEGFLSSPSEKDAYNVGRGLSPLIFIIDEFAFIKNIAISLPAALAGGGAVVDIAKENNSPYGSIFMTTAGKIDDRDGGYAYQQLMDSAPWTEAYYDIRNIEVLHKTITLASRSSDLMVDCTFSHRQLGYTDEWLAGKIRAAKQKGQDAERDYLNKWTNGSRSHPLHKNILEIINGSKNDSAKTTIDPKYGYAVRWYLKDIDIVDAMYRKTIMGVDSSNASGKDDIAIIVRDVESGSVIAAANINETNMVRFSEWLTYWFIQYPEMTCIIENRSSGSYILDYLASSLLASGIIPHRRLYSTLVDDMNNYGQYRGQELLNTSLGRNLEEMYARFKQYFGFTTSGAGKFSRSELYSTTLTEAARITGHVVNDPKTIAQISALEEKNGRVDHPAGGHDDNVIAWMLTYWFLTKAKNLQHYGIKASTVLTEARFATRETVGLEDYKYRKYKHLMGVIEILGDDIRRERDHLMRERLESIIRMKAVELEKYRVTDEIFSADAFLQSLRGKRMLVQNKQEYRPMYREAA